MLEGCVGVVGGVSIAPSGLFASLAILAKPESVDIPSGRGRLLVHA